nr:glycoside hydrolase family 1 protein [Clostridium felsineum]
MMEYKLPQNFILGAATSAWQAEGWTDKNGRDNFVDMMYKAAPERWNNGIGPTIADDFYNKWSEDIDLMKKTGLSAIRISIDWSRFIDNYENATINEKGAQFYDNVIDKLNNIGIMPMICLEHWELPKVLYDKYGGYDSLKIVDLYVKYAKKVFERYNGKVKYFWTFNEPIVIPQLCFMDGFWYPYKTDTKLAMQWIYGKILANAKVVAAFKEMNITGKIGIILNPSVIYSRSELNENDKKAKEVADLFYWKSFMDPCIKGQFPKELIDLLKKENCMFEYKEEDLAIIKNNTIDILGFNYYQPMRVMGQRFKPAENMSFHPTKYFEEYDMPGKKINPYRGWEIYPKALYDAAMRIKNEYNNIEWMVTESGMGVEGEEKYKNEDGVIQDDYRIDFYKEHLVWLLKAMAEGSNCKGYMVWNWLDNISPVNSLKNRYGLVELDLKNNRKRRIKKSGYWFNKLENEKTFHYKTIDQEYK